mgnify:FL=1|tara:strand:+ start:202 stop:375 length:174 start_codon:yes stop_codon:yes gene_type:complete
MSCLHNENLKENIMNEILEMNVGDFIETLYEKGFTETLKVDSAITKLVEEKFENLGE